MTFLSIWVKRKTCYLTFFSLNGNPAGGSVGWVLWGMGGVDAIPIWVETSSVSPRVISSPTALGRKRKEIVSGHRLWEIYRGVGCICEKSLANLSGYRLCLRVYRLPDRDCIGVSSISVSDCIGVSAISVNNCIGVMAMSVRVVSALNLPVSIQPFFNN